MNKNKSFGFIGGGRIVKIMLQALINTGNMPSNVVVSDTSNEVLNHLAGSFPGITISNDNLLPANCDYVFISLHPPVIAAELEKIRSLIKPQTILISLAPKIKIAAMTEKLGGHNKIARMIPNAPSIINKGYNPVCFGEGITVEEKAELMLLFNIFGEAPEKDENMMEAYAILTAMGPTYLWFQLNELSGLVQSYGMSKEDAETGIRKMVEGALATLYSGMSFEEVVDLVPVKPLKENEESIKNYYHTALDIVYKRISC